MPPRKKPSSSSSSSKKSNPNNQAQPSKFGIQHFFERHTQNALQASQKHPRTEANANSSIPNVTGSEAVAPKKLVSVLPEPENVLKGEASGLEIANSKFQNPKDNLPLPTNEANLLSENTLSENMVIPGFNVAENLPEVSPEISKIVPHKRFKFSPGMVVNLLLAFLSLPLF